MSCDACKKEQLKSKLVEARIYQGTTKETSQYRLTEIETTYNYTIDKEYFIYEICHKCIKREFIIQQLFIGSIVILFAGVFLFAMDWFTFYQNLFLLIIIAIILYLVANFLSVSKGTARDVAGSVAISVAEKEFKEEQKNIQNFSLFTETEAFVIIESDRLRKEGKLF